MFSCTGSSNEGACLYPIREGNLYGYVNTSGKVVIPPQFAYCLPFCDSLGAVNIGGNTSGRDMPPDGKWGFVNTQGVLVINPKFDPPPIAASSYVREELGLIRHTAYQFSEGLAPVIKDGKWVYIDSRGNIKLSPDNGLPVLGSARGFREGLANVMINGKWGYIDLTGNEVIRPTFIYPADFEDGHVLVVTNDLTWMIINRDGKRLLPEYRIVSNFRGGYAAVMGDFKGVPENRTERLRYWFTDTAGIRTPEEPQFDLVGQFGSQLCPVLVGSEASQEMLNYPGLMQAAKRIGGKWGFIREDGSFYIPPTFDGSRSFHQGMVAVKKGDFWAYMDTNANYLSDFEFRWAGDFDPCGVAHVQLGPAHNDYDGRFAYFNLYGDIFWIEPDLPYE